jgi:choline dehydrogenase-like flavoprotein
LGPALDGVKAAILLVAGADAAAHDLLARSAATPPARPDAELDVTPSGEWPGITTADCVVVGSGAGGAVAARTLARAGMRVVVLEEGRRHTVEEFRSRHPLERFRELYRDGGVTAALGVPPVMLPIGRGVGGTTLVNSGTCYRTPARVLEAWRRDAGLGLADASHFERLLDEVEAMLQTAPVPMAVMGRNGELALAGAAALGWRAGPIVRNAPGCGGCCQCAIGCPRNAKFGVHLNALPDACAHGARIVSEARVRRILHEGGRALGVEAERPDGSLFVVRAERVVVAAGATETPPLLRRSGLGRHPELGRNLAVHPAVATAGRFREPVVAWQGVLQSAAVEELHDTDGILIEATSTPPGMGSMTLPGFGPELLAELETADHLATLGAMVADLPSGRVLGRSRPVITYRLARRDAARLLRAIVASGDVLFAAGATEVLTGLPRHPRARSPRELREAADTARSHELHVAAFHPTGTCRAGADPARHPADEYGRLRGALGVWVCDASVLPTCPEVNPQVSIMALAMGIAEGIS